MIVRICEGVGCKKRLPQNRRKCDDCKAPKPAEYVKTGYQLWYFKPRWKKLSRTLRDQNPFCVICKDEGRITRSTQVDHIEPHRGNEALFWDIGNLQAICAPCHSKKSRREYLERSGEI